MAFLFAARAAARRRFRKANCHYDSDPVVGERAEIFREDLAPIKALFYYPASHEEKLPVFVQVHGGAWVGLDAVVDDRYCQRLADELGAFVVNVNYRRLYDEPFPYAQTEVADTVRWLKEHAEELGIDPDRIVISGGSAGGHICAGAAIMCAHSGLELAGQILEVPFLDFTGQIPAGPDEIGRLADKLLACFSPKTPRDSEVMSPATCAKDSTLSIVAPACVIVCGRDPLKAQGECYADRLRKQSRLMGFRAYEEGYHGFGTENADELPAQHWLREECFAYKADMARAMFRKAGKDLNDEA